MSSYKISPSPAVLANGLSRPRRPAELARTSRGQEARNWLRLALHPATVRRALFTAALVGSVLILINHSEAILRGDFEGARLTKMFLTMMVPYIVSTVSSVSTRRELGQRHG